MNKIYKLIWSKKKEAWVAVSEKVAAGWFRRPIVVGALSIAVLLATGGTAKAIDPNALPTGGQVVAGQANIAQSGNAMTVNQQTDKMIANWNTFNIGQNASVAFQQPGASSVALNRILDQNPSQIYGRLSANGQVFLLNPAGVYFGPTAQVDVGGLVASSLSLSNENFLAGKYHFENTGIAGAVSNMGQIRTADGGYVAFLSPRITNEGTITAPGGTVALAAGDKVSLDFTGDRLVNFTVDQGAIDALIENRGLVKADGGLVKMSAKAADELIQAVVNNEGIIEAKGIANKGGRIILDADQVIQSGSLDVSHESGAAGSIDIAATGMLMNTGGMSATGHTGGNISVSGRAIIEAGSLDASGAAAGGHIHLNATESMEQTAGSRISANATQGQAGTIRAEAQGGAYLSGAYSASGTTGGNISITADSLVLAGATAHADGATGGGLIRIGGGWQGNDADLPNAATTTLINATLTANATQNGNGGTVAVWSDETTYYHGRIEAKGGLVEGGGGRVEVSSRSLLGFGGTVDVTAPHGQNGSLLLDPKNIEIVAASSSAFDVIPLTYSNPQTGDQYGSGNVVELKDGGASLGKLVVSSYLDNTAASNAGAVRLYSITDGALLATLTGSTASDCVGSDGVTALSNGNYVVRSSSWDNGTAVNAGAVTWGSGVSGVTGVVSSTNSLVGSTASDSVGYTSFTELSNGNYVVISSSWDNGTAVDAGAVTWGSGVSGVTGVVSSTNSLVGSTASDYVGSGSVTALSNGNYVVISSSWDNGTAVDAGAVTWGSGASGVTGVVSSTNSLVGSTTSDYVGSDGVTALSNGNYVVSSQDWDNGTVVNAGAVTWGSGASGVTGVVSSTNSLVGSTACDSVGYSSITELSNGNYVVRSYYWDNGTAVNAGAVTWGSGASGVTGVVSSTNSLVGSRASDSVGLGGVTELSNGNYVVRSYYWDNGTAVNAGAVTWGSGASGVTGVVSSTNSLVGSRASDSVGLGGVTALSNGNYVVSSYYWDNGTVVNAGAVTWGSGVSGVTGVVSSTNSLVGSKANDSVGETGVTALSNSNYVVRSKYWDNGTVVDAGAVTWGSGVSGVTGVVSSTNSLVGSRATDYVGSDGVIALSNGNYVVKSSNWDNGTVVDAGAVTWGSGASGVTGVVSSTNSLVGSTASDSVGYSGVIELSNGNYVVRSDYWNNGTVKRAGAVTWGSGDSGVKGVVSSANSLVGSAASDYVGSGSVTALSNGNYVVKSSNWDNGTVVNAGAVTWGSGDSGVKGVVSSANSLVGSAASDYVGSGVTALSNGNYVVISYYWDNGTVVNAGAVTWGSGDSGVKGVVSSANSLVGSRASDSVGSDGVTAISNGNYVVRSKYWDNGTVVNAGAVTWGSGDSGVKGVVSSANSLVGSTANDSVGSGGVTELSNGAAVVRSPYYNGDGKSDTGRVDIIKEGSDPWDNPLAFSTNASQKSTIGVSSITDLLNAGTAVTLQANNDITLSTALTANNTSGGGGALTLQAGRSIFLNDSIVTDNGNLTLTANETTANGVLDAHRDSGAAVITMLSEKTIDAGSGEVSITLADGAGKTYTESGAVTLQGIAAGSLTVSNQGPTAGSGISLGATTLSGNLTLTAAKGDIAQTDALSVAGTTSLTAGAGNNVTMDNASNNFTGAVSIVSGKDVSLRDTNVLELGASTVSGNLTLQTGGALTQTGALTVIGTTGVTAGAGNNVTMDNASNDFTGAVSIVSGGTVSLKDADSLTIGTSDISGDLTAEALGGDLTIAGDISKTSGADATAAFKATGSIIQNAATEIESTSNKLNTVFLADTDANGGAIQTITTSSIATNGGNVTLQSSYAGMDQPLIIGGNVNAGAGNIDLTGNALTLTGILSGSGTLTVQPKTAGATIGVAGGAGTLQITADNFSTNFADGFSGITVGNASAGAIATGGNFAVNDNTTFKSGANITVGSGLNWSGATKLTLETPQTVNVNAAIENTNTTSGGVYFSAGNTTTKVVFGENGKVVIHNAEQLQWMNTALAGKYELGGNVDASATSGWNGGLGFAPVGNSSTKFIGTFDGLGHTISGLTINRPSTDYVGLFGDTNAATVSNVGMTGGSIEGKRYVGELVGRNYNYSTITNSYATGSVTGTDQVGGLVGENEGHSTITNSYATGTVTGQGSVGGLVGYSGYSTIQSSYATGTVTGTNNYVGGLIGYNYKSTVTNSYATGAATGTDQVGGLVGRHVNDSSITNSYATGAVTGSSYVGGLVGVLAGTITKSYATGAVTGSADLGGLVGYKESGTVTSSFYDRETTGRSDTGKGTPKTTAEMKTLATFSGAGWDIDGAGGTGKVWRMYEGDAYPLLRSFLTAATATVKNDLIKVYDGSTTVASGSHTWDIAVDEGKVFGTAVYTSASKNAGNRVVALTGLYSNQQGYDIKTQDGAVSITPKALAVDGTTASDKTYDGNTNAAITVGTLSGFVGTETVTTTAAGVFDSKNAGSRKAEATYTLHDGDNGGLADNYSLANTTDHAATINKKILTVAGLAADNKTYDSTTNVTISNWGGVTTGVGTETLVLNHETASFDTKNVGTGKTVTAVNYSLANGENGGLASNYDLTSTSASTTANITAKPITTTGVTASNKVYDGSLTASLNKDAAVITGGAAAADDNKYYTGDDVSLNKDAAAGAFSDKNVGTNKAVSVSGFTLAGEDASNYTVSDASNAKADITRLATVAWTGGETGEWFNPANWAGGAIPDLANVAAVTIPGTVTVNFDDGQIAALAEAGTVYLDSITGTGATLVMKNNRIETGGLELNRLTSESAATLKLTGDVNTIKTSAGLNLAGDLILPENSQNTISNFDAADIIISSPVTLTGGSLALFTDTANSITLNNPANDFTGTVSVTQGGNVTLFDANALSLGASTVSGNLLLQTGGAITQTGALTVAGTTGITAGANDITLADAANDFTGAVSIVSGKDVSLRDTNALNLGASTVSGNLLLQTGGAITQTGALTVAGTTGITAGANDITLADAANDFTGAVSIVSGKDVNLRDANALILGATTASGGLTLQSGGAITQTGTLSVSGTTGITAGANDITLSNAANDFTGAVSIVSGKDVSLKDSTGGITIGSSNVSGNLTVDYRSNAGGITLAGTITKDSGADATLTFWSFGTILLDENSAIKATSGKLNTVLRTDTDIDGDYIHLKPGASISTGGGHIWMGGGGVSTLWNGLTVGNGYAVGTAAMTNGVYLQGATLTSGGGHIALYGRSHSGAAVDDQAAGIRLASTADKGAGIDAGTGSIVLDGESQGTSGWAIGVEFNSAAGKTVTVASAATSGDAIAITGDAGGASSATGRRGVSIDGQTAISATGGGNIVVKGHSSTEESIYMSGGTLSSGGGNLTLVSDIINLDEVARISGAGVLTIQPWQEWEEIGIAGGAGKLQLPADYFSTNFVDGFSGITIGWSNAGPITTGGNFAIRDDMTLKSGGDITIGAGLSWEGANKLTLDTPETVHVNAAIENTSATTGVYFSAGNTTDKVVFGANGKVILHNVQQLQWMNTALAGKYELGANIDASATSGWNGGLGFAPVGDSTNNFTGVLDGKGHTINALVINRASSDVGLFGRAGSGSEIKNVGLAGGSVQGGAYVGGLVGYLSSGAISNAFTTCTVTGTNQTGGLVGFSLAGIIQNSYASGAVTSSVGSYTGGLVAGASGGSITNSYATGAVYGKGQNAGGLVGAAGNLAIANSYAAGAVTSDSSTNIGGLLGGDFGGSAVTNSFYDKDTTGQSDTGKGTGLTTADMKTLSTFSGAGWDIDGAGGTGKIWRLYEGDAYPLLRSFLTAATATVKNDLTKVYDGSTTVAGGSHTWDIPVDEGKVFGTAVYTAASKNVGNRAVTLTGLYSNQQGYDISVAAGQMDISKKALAVTGLTADNKTYDGTTDVTIGNWGSVTTGVGTETLTLNHDTASFDTKNVGTGKTVVAVNYSLADGANGGLASNYDLTSTSATTTADITKKALAVTGLAADNKTYDGTTDVTIGNWGSVTTGVGTETLTLNHDTASFDTKNVGTGKTVTAVNYSLSDGANGGLASNYDLTSTSATTTADITKKALAVTGLAADNKTYDGTTDVTIGNWGSVTTGVGTETLTLNHDTASFDTKNVGTGKTVTAVNYSLADGANGGLASNYDLTSTSATTTADITKKALAVTGLAADNKTYDGTTDVTIGNWGNVTTGVGTETLTLNHDTASFDTKNVGTGKTVTAVNYSLADGANGGLASNYDLTSTSATTTADITKKAIAVTGLAADNKTYDGTTDVTIGNWGSVTTGVGTETLTLNHDTASFDTKNVGTGKTVTAVNYSLSDGANGGLASNYDLTSTSATTTADITKKALAVTGLAADNKTYDGTTDVTIGNWGNVTTGVGTETLTLNHDTASFDTKNVGTGKTVTAVNYSLSDGANGGLASNYDLTSTSATTTADITKKAIAVTGLAADNKTYDGTTDVTIGNWGNVTTGVGTETLTLNHDTASFDTKNVGTGKTVTAVNYSLSDGANGGLASNYDLTSTSATTTADITKKALAVTGLAADNKTYDGTTDVTIGNWGSVTTDVGTETLTLNHDTASFDTKNVGTGKTVTAVNYSLADGANGGLASNYDLTSTSATTTADINKKALAVTGLAADNKTYDGTTDVTIGNWGSVTTGVGTETLTLNHDTASFDTKNVGTGKTVTAVNYSLSDGANGGLASNYDLTSTSATTTADITKKAIAISGITASNKVYDANTNAAVDASKAAGWIAGDALSVSATGTFDTKNVGTDKTVTLSSSYSGADKGNYTITDQATTTADITPKGITISGITAANKVYDAATSATVDTTSAAGWIAGDALSVSATGTFDTKNVGTDKTVTLSSSYSGADKGNYTITDQAATTADITPKAITISGITAANKVYDATTSAAVDTTSATGWIAGDALSVSATGTFDTKNVGTNKTVTLSSTYSGADKGNYTITDQAATTADITPKAITISGITASNKVYDANTNAAVDTTSATGWIAGDAVSVSATGTFDTKNVGTNKTVTLSSTYSGADKGNYTITDQAAATADITPKAITISGITASNKVYDANTNAAVDTTSATGWIAGDAVSVSATGTFDTKNVGTNKTVTLSSTYSGADKGNYTITDQAAATADITPKAITISGITASNKVYDANTNAAVDTTSATGWIAGDAVSVSATGTFDTKNVGTNKTVTLSSSYSGADKGNYTITDQAATTADITPAPLTVTANDASKTYGQTITFSGTEFISNGLIGGEAIGMVTLASAGAPASAGVADSPYDIVASDAGGGTFSPGNYTITYKDGALAVSRAALTVTANSDTKYYTGIAYSGGNGVAYTGFVNGEAGDVLGGALTYGGTSQGAISAGNYNIVPGGLTSNNYQISFAQGVLTIKGNPVQKEAEAVEAYQISNQNSINGTQEGQGNNPGTPRAAGMGPGAGSGNVVPPPVLNPPATTGAVLSSTNFASPVTLSTSGQTTTITVTGATSAGPMNEVGALPVFTQSGGAPPALQGNFVVHQNGAAVSLTPTTTTGQTSAAPGTDISTGKSAPFTLSLENGITLQMTATVTPDGVLVVSAPDTAGHVDVQQAILMGAQVARQALQVELSSLSSALFVRN